MINQRSCVIIDYGIGNIFSVAQAVKQCGVNVEVTSSRNKIMSADQVILPGVGAFGRAAKILRQKHLDDTIKEYISTGRPFLGICVGMQLMMDESHEFGVHQGLGIIGGTVKKINLPQSNHSNYRIPVIGWNTPVPVNQHRWKNGPFNETSLKTSYYFVHSYSVTAESEEDVVAKVSVGENNVVAAIQRENVIGVQFHPERSSHGGLKFIKGFLKM